MVTARFGSWIRMATLNARPRPARSRYLMPGGVTDVPRADIGIDVAVPCDHLNVSPAAVASFDASHYEGFKINRPSGTITFLFTDVEGSSRLWDEHPDAMATALRQHDSILRAALEGHGGYIFTTAGDSFSAAFSMKRWPRSRISTSTSHETFVRS